MEGSPAHERSDAEIFKLLSDEDLRKNMNFYFWEGDDLKEGERYQKEFERREKLRAESLKNQVVEPGAF